MPPSNEYSQNEFMIYESVEAVLTEDVSQLLAMKSNTKFLKAIKRCSELLEVYEHENGKFTLHGTLKAILNCQKIIQAVLRKLKPQRKEVSKDHGPSIQDKNFANMNSVLVTCSMKTRDSGRIKNEYSQCAYDEHKEPLNRSKVQLKPVVTTIITLPNTSSYSGDTATKKLEEEHNLSKCTNNYLKLMTKKENCNYKGTILECGKTHGECYYNTETCLEELVSFCESDASLERALPSQSDQTVKFSCNLCFFSCIKESSYIKHLHCHEKGKSHSTKYVCEVCGLKEINQRRYRLHIENAHPVVYSCSQCSYKTTKKCHYNRHIQNVHENQRPFECQVCGVTFKRRDTLKQHHVIHVKDPPSATSFEPAFRCKVCRKIVRSAAYLREHMLTHADSRSFLCEVCGASFKTRSVHRNHLKVVHSQGPKVTCKKCGRSFATTFSLRRHTSQHKECLYEPKETKFNEKLDILNSQEENSDDWNSLIHCTADMTADSSLPAGVEGREVIVALPKPVVGGGPMADGTIEKTIASIYSETGNSESFGISIDNQIPYIIHCTQEVISN